MEHFSFDQPKITSKGEKGQEMYLRVLGCVRSTLFWNRNSWNTVINPSFYGDSHYISKHLLKCYFKHIFIIFVASKRQAYPFKSLLHVFLERFSNECRKTKTKVITLANQKGRRQSSKPIKTRSYTWPTQSAGKCARASYDWFWFHF